MVEIKGNDTPMEKIRSSLDEVNIGNLRSMKEEAKKEQ